MVSGNLASRIDSFISYVGEPYDLVENVFPKSREDVIRNYMPETVQLSEQAREDVLFRLEASWRNNQDHRHIRRWGRAAIGVAEYLLRPTSLDEANKEYAADVIVRISRWYHTDTNLWIRFKPDAQYIVEQIWGDIEDLYRA